MTFVAAPAYITVVLKLFVDLPATPRRASSYDQAVARSLERGVPLHVVESALLLGSLRRQDAPKARFLPVRSLAYFSSVIEEIQQQPLPASYCYQHGGTNYWLTYCSTLLRISSRSVTIGSLAGVWNP